MIPLGFARQYQCGKAIYHTLKDIWSEQVVMNYERSAQREDTPSEDNLQRNQRFYNANVQTGGFDW